MRISSSDPLGRYYTKSHIAHLLVRMMGGFSPRSIIDVGAGRGTLSVAAGGRWAGSDICTVDIDEDCVSHLSANLANIGLSSHVHFTLDALDADLPKRVKRNGSGFDASISNPPYSQPVWRQGFDQILCESGLDSVFSALNEVSIDVVYIAQLLRLTCEGGTVGLIVPDGIITGIKHYRFRQLMVAKFDIECVIQLPRNSFMKTEAQAFILVLRNKPPVRRAIPVLRFDLLNGLSTPIRISLSEAEQRMDYGYYSIEHGTHILDKVCLEDLGADIKRGKINSSEVKSSTSPIFHTSNFPLHTGSLINFGDFSPPAPIQPPSYIIAETGDILLARVDRNLHRKVALVAEGKVPISDCIYRIRVREEFRLDVLSALSSGEGSASLQRAARGVGAKMLNKHDLLRLPLWSLGMPL